MNFSWKNLCDMFHEQPHNLHAQFHLKLQRENLNIVKTALEIFVRNLATVPIESPRVEFAIQYPRETKFHYVRHDFTAGRLSKQAKVLFQLFHFGSKQIFLSSILIKAESLPNGLRVERVAEKVIPR